ncbi:hypothetical protein [Escherichia coli]|nr:hypothetical protein [Escherichia coli]
MLRNRARRLDYKIMGDAANLLI